MNPEQHQASPGRSPNEAAMGVMGLELRVCSGVGYGSGGKNMEGINSVLKWVTGWNSSKSKEDLTQQISKSIFVTNFSDHIRARDLKMVCKEYDSIVDVYIPLKKSKSGKRFAEKKPTSSFHNNTKPLGIPRGHTLLVTNSGNNKSSFASLLKEGSYKNLSPEHSIPALVLDDSCFKDRDFSLSLMGKVRDASAIPNLYIILLKEGFQSVKLRYLGGLWVLIKLDSLDSVEKFQNHVGVGSWFSLIKPACNSFVSDERIVWISIEGLPINSWTRNTFSKIVSKWGDLVASDESDVMNLSCKHLCLKTKINIIINECFKIIIKEKVYWLRAKELDAWVPKFLSEEECDSSEDGESDDFGKGRNFGDMEFDNSNSNAESDVEKVSESSCMRETNSAQKKVVTPQPNESDPTYPPGFTPNENHNDGENTVSPKDQVMKTPNTSMGFSTAKDLNFLSEEFFVMVTGSSPRIKIDSEFPTRLNSNQVEDLKRPISQEKIKKAVWIVRFITSSLLILATRLSLVMSDLISDMQTAFVSSRQILDGPFILNEFLSWCKHKKINAMIFKVDFKKAFDSVRWDYLNDVLKSFGFGIKWCSWISGCLDSSMGSVLVNGHPTPEFHFYKGLKQGDPLSPFLFILVMERLHISFSRVIAFGLFKGVNINNSLTLSHLFYADDAIFVGKWDINNIKTILNVLNCFFLASGLKINLHKSKLTGIGVNKDGVDSAATLVGCSTFYPPFHYLGVKVGASMSRLNSWKEVMAKISSRLSKWKLETLSLGGRLTLLKSVLTAIPIYHMSLYKVPVGILNDMESIRRNFFNGIEKSEIKMVWIRWETILASKKNGGLGVFSFFSTNRSLLFKWIWRFLSQDSSLWSRFIQAIHGVRGAIDNKNSSIKCLIWLDIVRDISSLNHKGIDLLVAAKRKLENGENTLFEEDKWIGEVTLKTKYPRLFALEQHKSITVAAKMGQPFLDHSFRQLPRGGIEDEQYRDLRTTTSNVLLPNMHDRWFWSLDSTGEFSVSSVRNYIDEFLLPKAGTPTRWIKLVPIKLNITAWRICLDKLPARLNLSSRGLDIPIILCRLCNESVESTSHILFSCQLARQLMAKVCRWWELDYTP
nr:RNA-directed DNA polymerase, eukaryota, reverse transcriptase zinc-binding domain protein [Tanacetum cinerariifolium]